MRDVSMQYRWACQDLPQPTHGHPSAAADATESCGALLHLVASRAAGVFLLGRPSARCKAAALAHVARLDAASEGVAFGKVVPLFLDLGFCDVKVTLGGEPQPLLALSALSLVGWLVRARQLAAPPLTTPLSLPVGRYHVATVQQWVKGCR